MENVLIKIIFNDSVDYRIVKSDIANILKSYISTEKFKKDINSLYKSLSFSKSKTAYFDITIIDDSELIDAYKKLRNNNIIDDSNIYDLLIEFLVNDPDDKVYMDADEITDNDIINAWQKFSF